MCRFQEEVRKFDEIHLQTVGEAKWHEAEVTENGAFKLDEYTCFQSHGHSSSGYSGGYFETPNDR